jgi:hypothetical protein
MPVVAGMARLDQAPPDALRSEFARLPVVDAELPAYVVDAHPPRLRPATQRLVAQHLTKPVDRGGCVAAVWRGIAAVIASGLLDGIGVRFANR